MKKTNKLISILLALAMFLTAAPISVLAADDIASGTAGEGISWVIDSDGTLTVSGTGEIEVDWFAPPWEDYNDSILNIVVEEGITLIPDTAFSYAENCVSVSIPASVTTIETYATPFWDDSSLETITVDEDNANYKSIDGILFSKDEKTLVYFPNNQGATEYTIPETVETIESDAFANNICLKSVTIPDTVSVINEGAFKYSKVEAVVLGNGITEIPKSCFESTQIKSIIIPDSITSIESSAFYNCSSLESLVIGSGVEAIGGYTLRYARMLSAIHYNGTQEEWNAIAIDTENTSDNGLLTKEVHFITTKAQVEATCKDGHTEGLYCETCEEYFTGEVIAADEEHTYNGDYICDVCGYEKEEECDSGCEHEFVLDGDIKTPVKCKVSGKAFYASDSRWHEVDSYEGNGKVSTVATFKGYDEETDEIVAYYVAESVEGKSYGISFDWAVSQGYINYGNFLLSMYHNGEEVIVRDFSQEVNEYANILSEKYNFVADGKLQVFKFVFEKTWSGTWADDGRTAYLNDIAIKEHKFTDGICECGYECEHNSDTAAQYTKTAGTHQLSCEACGITEAAEAHDIVYYNNRDGKCTPYCNDCGYIDILAEDHEMTAYDCYDDEHCINYCMNCGYGYDEMNLTKHSFATSVSVAATGKEAAHTKNICEKCYGTVKEYDKKNVIFFELYSEYMCEWENSAILVYENGEPVNLIRNMTGHTFDTFAMPYDANSSYVFKWINAGYNEEFGVKIYVPGSQAPVFEQIDMSEYEMLQTIFSLNVADYSDVDAALAEIPEYLEYYSADSVANLVTAVKGVKRMLSASKQSQVDAMAKAIENAVDALVEIEDPIAHGVINMSAGNYIYINDSYYSVKSGYTYCSADTDTEIFYEYDGKYVILETEAKDAGNEDYVKYGFYVYDGEIEIDLVNTFITGYYGNLGVYNEASAVLNLFGANALACYDAWEAYYAGIDVSDTAKLHIKDSDGSLIVIGENDCAGIGSWYDNYDEVGTDSGEIIIDGGTIFALSTDDGAGIGGGYEGGAGKITINGGTIWAECMSNDGAGIGVGDDGSGGEIIINGGEIIALSVDDDGAGIGGADYGHIDSITINGGTIVAGSDDGAAIGGGQDEESYGGKIIINGGHISASEWHDIDENLIGNGNDNSVGETEYNFVQINGGYIDTTNSAGISPEPKTQSGSKLVEETIEIHESLIGTEITIELSDGTTFTSIADGTTISVYLPEGVAVENADKLATGYCDHSCHRDGFIGFLWKIVNFFNKLFGLNPVCECGTLHYGHTDESLELVPDDDTAYEDTSYIDTTLENPEFVAADNEATNVLANGD